MSDDIDPAALIEAAAALIRVTGIPYLEAQAQVRQIFAAAWDDAATFEALLADLDPPTASLH
jgi:hypothetical protein